MAESESHADQLRLAIELFNQQEFFACHDVLEEVWSETLDESREFYQGLIHVAVALFHFTEGNLGGARKMYHSAMRYLEPFGDESQGVNLAQLRDDFTRCCAPLLEHDHGYPVGAVADPALIPCIEYRQF
ncbi:MAG: DUF309 domain-containing protein [Planctomycetaceae bacterium]|nr:DUF309 domain-containing protein [Planctomycetaceae bacterium]